MNSQGIQSNPQLDLAFEYVLNTNTSLFLTGKAGTGKTTFLQRLRTDCPKRIAVVAPTGVAAINAGGVTIHSMFQLPFTPFIPNQIAMEQKRFQKEKINLLKSIDLLVIDEISMVRCDILDAVDSVLKRYRNPHQPFGGLQLLLIGDINQLAPVAKEEEWSLLRRHYDSVYFFSSHALRQKFPVIIELQHIFRQSDRHFIDLLNKVRNNRMSPETFELLNYRLNPNIYEDEEDDGYITLSTHNATAREINLDKLERLQEEAHFFEADVTGDFSEYAYPTDVNLQLKKGAQVMFLKNESGQRRYFNGKIGKVSFVDSDRIVVTTDDTGEIEVGLEEWQNIRYTLNPETKAIEEQVIGSFKQYPLKLAYAITIHKSQGLTFDKVIIDAQDAFSSGQVYVALSRCRTLEGIVLSTPILGRSIKSDADIDAFNRTISSGTPDEKSLGNARFSYQESLLNNLLDFGELRYPLLNLKKKMLINSPPVERPAIAAVDEIMQKAETEIGMVMLSFQKQIKIIIQDGGLPENNTHLLERLKKGSEYFIEKINQIFLPLRDFYLVTDNKKAKEMIHGAWDELKRALFIKLKCFEYCLNGFSPIGFLQARSHAEIDFQKVQPVHSDRVRIPKSIAHPELYTALRTLRKNLAIERGIEEFRIFQQATLMAIVNNLPCDFKSLQNIKGIGNATSTQFGMEIIDAVTKYCGKHGIEPTPTPVAQKRETGASQKLSFDMYLNKMTVPQIAKQRELAESTIEGHLSRFVETGQLPIEAMIGEEKRSALATYFDQKPEVSLSEAKAELGDNFSYSDLRFFNSYRRSLQAAEINKD